MQANFKYHPIGQGLFYSGNIKQADNKEFNFIYDCGTSNFEQGWKQHQNDVITDYTNNELSSKVIDLFIISHFHFDHISGLTNGEFDDIKIDLFVIPYYTRIQRLLLLIEIINNQKTIGRDIEDYFVFVENPVQFLKDKFRDCKIIVITDNNDGDDNGNTLITSSIIDDLQADNTEGDSSGYFPNKDVVYRKSKGRIYIKEIWEFMFYFQKHSEDKIQNFQEELNGKFSQFIDSEFKKLLKSKNNCDAIKKAYSKLKVPINDTSLITFHYPLVKSGSAVKISSHGNSKVVCYKNQNRLAQLLTGDINLSNSNISLKALDSHFNNNLNNTAIFQVPHHGSDKNWNQSIYNYISNVIFSVISSGNVSFYNHPGKQVISFFQNESYIKCNRDSYALIEYDFKLNHLRYIKLKRLLMKVEIIIDEQKSVSLEDTLKLLKIEGGSELLLKEFHSEFISLLVSNGLSYQNIKLILKTIIEGCDDGQEPKEVYQSVNVFLDSIELGLL